MDDGAFGETKELAFPLRVCFILICEAITVGVDTKHWN